VDTFSNPSQPLVTTFFGQGSYSSTVQSVPSQSNSGAASSHTTSSSGPSRLAQPSRDGTGGTHDDDDDDDDGRPPHHLDNAPADDVTVSTDSAAEIEEEIRQLDELLAGELPDEFRATFTQQRQALLQTRAEVLNARQDLAANQRHADQLEREFQQKQAEADRLEAERQAAEQARMDAERQEAERQRHLQTLADRAARSAKLLAKTSSALNAHNQQLAQVHKKVNDLQTNVVRADQTIRSLSSASPSPAAIRPSIFAARNETFSYTNSNRSRT
jgi:hypothetical protein